jgi:hypothetical protein
MPNICPLLASDAQPREGESEVRIALKARATRIGRRSYDYDDNDYHGGWSQSYAERNGFVGSPAPGSKAKMAAGTSANSPRPPSWLTPCRE